MSRQLENTIVSIVGNGGVGKSTIRSILSLEGIQEVHLFTFGIEAHFCPILEIAGVSEPSILMFDHAGQKTMRVKSRWKQTRIFILVFDCRYHETYVCMETWISQIREMNISSPIYIVGTKIDLIKPERQQEIEMHIQNDYPDTNYLLINSHRPKQVWAMFGAILIQEKILNDCSYARHEGLKYRLENMPIINDGGDNVVDLMC